MESMANPDEHDHADLDLALSIGGTLRNLPAKSTSTASGSSSALIARREVKRKRDEEDDNELNPPLEREKKLLKNGGSECNVQLPYPYTYSPWQCVPFVNGYAFPCMMPYWAAGSHAGAGTLHQPVACRSFRPLETNRSGCNTGLLNGCQLEQSGSKNKKSGSSSGSSPVCSSSVISDNYQSSSSHEGGGSSYTRTNSCNSSSDRHQTLYTNPNPNPNPIDSLNCGKLRPCSENRRTQCQEKFVEAHVSKICFESNKDEVVVPSSKSVMNPMNNMKMENGKPPKPQIQSRNLPSLEQMPCVSTTGVGPNGRTITGFLYRYSNLEVSILCACHGESFSPAEFVKHAGGGDISHPMRHITVLPTR